MNQSMIERKVKTNTLQRDKHGCLRYGLKTVAISDGEREKRKARLVRRWVKKQFRLAGLPLKAVERGAATKGWKRRDAARERALNAMSAGDKEAIQTRLAKRFNKQAPAQSFAA